MTESVDLAEIVWDRKTRVLDAEIVDDLVDGRGDLQEQRVINKLGITVKWELETCY